MTTNLITWLVVGLIAGWLASRVLRGGGFGLIGDIIVGVAGGLLGGWVATTFLHIGAAVTGINWGSILVAFSGSLILLVLLHLLSGGRRRVFN